MQGDVYGNYDFDYLDCYSQTRIYKTGNCGGSNCYVEGNTVGFCAQLNDINVVTGSFSWGSSCVNAPSVTPSPTPTSSPSSVG